MKRYTTLFLVILLLFTTYGCQKNSSVPKYPDDASSVAATSAAPTPEPAAVSPAPLASPEPELSDRGKKWKSDLTYLKNHLVKTHPEPFYYCSEEEFDWRAGQLPQKVEQLSDSDMFFELAALVASLCDSHTMAYPPIELFDEGFPVGFFGLGNKVYLKWYMSDYEQFEPFLLREIVGVNGVGMDYILQKLASFTEPAQASCIAELYAEGYFSPAFFNWAGCDHTEGYTFQILDRDGKVHSVEVPVISTEKFMQLRETVQRPENWEQITYLKGGNWVEYSERDGQGCVYMSFAEMPETESPYQELFDSTRKLLDEHPDSKLVIDLRLMPGGVDIAFPYVQDGSKLLKECGFGKAYVLTGRYTASAAIFCLSVFKEDLGATVVGEPTRQFTKFFCPIGMNTDIVLPGSQITVQVSGTWYEIEGLGEPVYDEEGKLYDWENTVLPEVYVEQDIEDLRHGMDTVMEWVWEQ